MRLAFLLLLIASPAWAWEPTGQILAGLSRGAYVEVRPDPDGASGLIRAAEEIAAPPEVVWAVLVDCDLAPRMAASLKSCRILERDPAGRWDLREQIVRPGLMPRFRSVVRSDFDAPRRLRFRRTGGDLKILEGEWRLAPLDGGRATRVVYESRAASPYAVPASLARLALRRDVLTAMAALKRESLARAASPR
ncbi:SRPBCC family protein [Phenylobacterium sp. 20VBR1]|uniref:SRPBCC family protein n=2 Tax=Phenylobacterium glaciei TaxID=2803784 RepID=A0A941CW85_9CAUL|nr:SRPBCC family protein [Phenylobacterium glaciei]MBR7617841.1 SRPBCC family protein [Phenylobacterium glaciei]